MDFKGCQRCNGDMRVEEDIVSRSEELVCLQCGRHQEVQNSGFSLSITDLRGSAPQTKPQPRERLFSGRRSI